MAIQTKELEVAAALRHLNFQAVVNAAIEHGRSEIISELMRIRTEMAGEAARDAYYTAMSSLQASMPIIRKDKEVCNKNSSTVRYKYATIDSIVQQVMPVISAHGFSFRFETSHEDGVVRATCVVTHTGGHSERSDFFATIDPGAFMSAPQQFAAAATFAKRYAFCNAFGIITGDADDDAESAGTQTRDLFIQMMALVRDRYDDISDVKQALAEGNIDDAYRYWNLFSQSEQILLWRAPTSGGIFTTLERAHMKSDEWSAARARISTGGEKHAGD